MGNDEDTSYNNGNNQIWSNSAVSQNVYRSLYQNNVGNQRMAQSNIVTVPLISVSLNANSFTAGDIIKGVLILQPKQDMFITQLYVKLQLTIGWVIPSDLTKSTCVDLYFDHIDLGEYKQNNNGIAKLSQNLYSFNFNIQIPNDIPPSFLFPKDEYNAFIRYSVVGEMTSTSLANWKDEKFIEITMPQVNVDKPFEVEKVGEVKNMKVFSMGDNLFRVGLNQGVYSYNEPISFNVHVDNTYCKATVNGIGFTIDRKITYFYDGYKTVYTESKQLAEGRDVNFIVGPGEIKGKNIKIKLKMGYDKKKDNEPTQEDIEINIIDDYKEEMTHSVYATMLNEIHFLMPTISNEFFKCEYKLTVNLLYDSFSSDQKVIEIPFVISSYDNTKIPVNINIDAPLLQEISEVQNENEMADAPPIAPSQSVLLNH